MKISRKALVFVLLYPCHSRVKYLATSYKIVDKYSLWTAVDGWISDRAQAEAAYGHINTWDVSEVTDMNRLFYRNNDFNDDISAWDTSRVSDMAFMFANATAFNRDLSAWDTSRVTNMYAMFGSAVAFNQDVSAWDVSNVTNMVYMFANALSFDRDLSTWNTSKVNNMANMFYLATSFNRDLSSWDTSNVTNMSYMFHKATTFNQDLSIWDTSHVTNMAYMFANAEAFRQTLCWDISKVTYTNNMFDSSNGRVTACAKPSSKPSPMSTTVKPTSSPTRKCTEHKEAKFLKAVTMKNYNVIPVMRSCEWLQKQKRAIRTRFCTRDSFYNAPAAKEMCKVTCHSCDVSYEIV